MENEMHKLLWDFEIQTDHLISARRLDRMIVNNNNKKKKKKKEKKNLFIIKGFRTIVFIFIVIPQTFRPICPLAFFGCLSNSGTYSELRTTSFIESTGIACSDSVSHNRVQVLSIPVLLLACSRDWTCNIQMIVSWEA